MATKITVSYENDGKPKGTPAQESERKENAPPGAALHAWGAFMGGAAALIVALTALVVACVQGM